MERAVYGRHVRSISAELKAMYNNFECDIMRSQGKRRTGQPNTTWTKNETTNSSRRKKNGKDLCVLWHDELWVNTYMY